MRFGASCRSCMLAGAVSGAADARVVRLVVEQRRPLAGGASFGEAGQYERLDGRAYFEVDPRDPRNAVIVNLDRAPRNARGMVEFSSTFYILKPVDIARGNGKVLFGLNNRGNSIELARFNIIPRYTGSDPRPAALEAGDGFLMKHGYTFVDVGWQGDLAPARNVLVPTLPDRPSGRRQRRLSRPSRIEYSDRNIPPAGAFSLTLEGSAGISLLRGRRHRSRPRLAHRPRQRRRNEDERSRAGRWAFGTCPTGQASLKPTASEICLFDGFKADKVYELIYPAKNPIVMGLGHATTRDLASFLRYERAGRGGHRQSAGVGRRRARRPARLRAAASSQTGIYLRDYVYLGFNEDETGRKVFDAHERQHRGHRAELHQRRVRRSRTSSRRRWIGTTC